jgi:hypothetical protein
MFNGSLCATNVDWSFEVGMYRWEERERMMHWKEVQRYVGHWVNIAEITG